MSERFEQFEDEALYELEEALEQRATATSGFPGLRRELQDEILREMNRRRLRIPQRPVWTSE